MREGARRAHRRASGTGTIKLREPRFQKSMKLFGYRVKTIYLKIALPLFAVWVVALVWSANHHFGNQRYRLNYLAKGVRGVADRNAAMIDPAELARIAGNAETGRLRFVLGEALKDLQYLPYFSELYKERVMGRRGEEQVFEFRVEVQRRLPDGRFVQVGADPPSAGGRLVGVPRSSRGQA